MPDDLREAIATSVAGRYRVERELGRGGMATVYLVHDLRHDRPLALKVLHPQLSVFLGRERFAREIAVASRLTHPNILPLHDSGEAGGLLFYLMPYVEGETLRDRLVHEHPLPLEEALRIARDIAAALAYAHDHNVVHRDIKPSNILLQAGAAIVADFGIARAIRNSVDTDALTDSGLVLGTPAYMSPEQASAEDLDGRSDVYSLGCVLYEMLAGGPPFSAASGRTLLARHSLDPVPPLRTVRPSIPASVEAAVMRALEKTPADRFASAAEFSAALRPTGSQEVIALAPPVTPRWRSRRSLLAAAAMAVLAAGWMGWRSLNGSTPGVSGAALALDSSRYLVFPLAQDSASAARFDATQMLQDALARWGGVSVVDQFQVREALARRPASSVTGDRARRIAAERGAGRYVRGELSLVGDSIRIHAILYDAGEAPNHPPLAERTGRVAADLSGADAAFAELADALLFRGAAPGGRAESPGTTSLAARQAFAMGQRAMQAWDLARADSNFAAAASHDEQYAQAHLWLALVRSWKGDPVATWRSAAERAGAGRSRLSSRDQVMSDAVAAQGGGDMARACAAWERLTTLQPHDFVAWYGSGDCQSRDQGVIPDANSPSGWRFRSSYHAAIASYRRAFQLLPSIHQALGASSFEAVRRLLKTSDNALRRGRGVPPDTGQFYAYASWTGDSVVFMPVPVGEFESPRFRTPDALRRESEAVLYQRRLFNELAAGWLAAFPASSNALEALAISLDMLGDARAPDTLRRARSLATSPGDRQRLGALEVWFRLRVTIPGDLRGVGEARLLADSVLAAGGALANTEPLLLASVAALTGRAARAASLARHPRAEREWSVPAGLGRAVPGLLAYAAMGGPEDSIAALYETVRTAIERAVPSPDREAMRLGWLGRPATLAFPQFRLRAIGALSGSGDPLVDGLAALQAGDSAGMRRWLQRWRGAPRPANKAWRTPDALLPEAWLAAELGQRGEAIAALDATLNSLAGVAPEVLRDPVQAAALMRAMILRARLADEAGDRATAQRWARIVTTLWSGADPFLQPLVAEMGRLAHAHPNREAP
jgi:serine/threonine protein kinase